MSDVQMFDGMEGVEGFSPREFVSWSNEINTERELSFKFLANKMMSNEFSFLEEVKKIISDTYGASSKESKAFNASVREASMLAGLKPHGFKQTKHRDSNNKVYDVTYELREVVPHEKKRISGVEQIQRFLDKGLESGKFTHRDIADAVSQYL